MIMCRKYKTYFNRVLLPTPAKYYKEQRLKLTGGSEWKNAKCPFHDDHQPSLRIRLDTGCFKCMACGTKGHDVLAFHRLRYNLSFKEAAIELGAWEESI